MALPTSARITQEWGNNFIMSNGQWAYPAGGHNGMDFAINNAAYYAPYPMTIISTAWDNSGYGNLIKARDTLGYTHWFAHNASYLVSPGQVVALGHPLGIADSTGFTVGGHLHWGVQAPGFTGYNGYINPRNWPGFNTQGNTMDERYVEDWARLAYLYYLGREPSREERRSRLNVPWDKAVNDIANSPEAKAYAEKRGQTIEKSKVIEFITNN